jgi:hypothetical protein
MVRPFGKDPTCLEEAKCIRALPRTRYVFDSSELAMLTCA